ncbi:hypothetical protein Peur_006017 [Populus x canadensis]
MSCFNYIGKKQAYLSKDLKNASSTLPSSRREDNVKKANELVDNMDGVCALICIRCRRMMMC